MISRMNGVDKVITSADISVFLIRDISDLTTSLESQ
jgi:hypothetical protein